MSQRSTVFAGQVERVLQEILKIEASFLEVEDQLRRLILDQLPENEDEPDRRAKRLRHLIRLCARNNARLDRGKRAILIEALLGAIQQRCWMKELSMVWEPAQTKHLTRSYRMSIHLAHELLARVEFLLVMECFDDERKSLTLFCKAARNALLHVEAGFFNDAQQPEAKNSIFSRRYARKLSREFYRLALFSSDPLDAANALAFKRRSGEALRTYRASITQAPKKHAPHPRFDGDMFAHPAAKNLLN